MALSNTAVPKYYGMFRDAVMRGEIPVCKEIVLQMNRIDQLIADPNYYYDDCAINGFIAYCENEMTLTDGSDLKLLDTFKLWAEDALSWFYFITRSVYVPNENGHGGHYETRHIKRRLCHVQFLIVARGNAKSLYISLLMSYFLNIDPSTTDQIVTAPTIRQATEILAPIKNAMVRSRGPLFKFLTAGSINNTTGSAANKPKLASTKKGIENFINGCIIEAIAMALDKLQTYRQKHIIQKQ